MDETSLADHIRPDELSALEAVETISIPFQ
jgi:hypothetical protein